jgi:hypothetical protein
MIVVADHGNENCVINLGYYAVSIYISNDTRVSVNYG